MDSVQTMTIHAQRTRTLIAPLASTDITTDVWVVTPDDAKTILSKHYYERQRRIHRLTVQRYVDSMRTGTWEVGTHLKFCVLGTQRFLIDGYHRLTALVEAQHTTTFTVSFVPVASMADIARHWAQTDNGKRRTPADMIAVFDYASITTMPPKWINATQSAASVLLSGGRTDRKHSQRVESIRDATLLYLPFGEDYFTAVSRNSIAKEIGDSHLRRSVFAVALLSYRYAASVDKSKVDAFWEFVHNDGLRKGDARQLAVAQVAGVGISGSSGRKKIISATEDFYYVAACFNAWWDGKYRVRIEQPTSFSMRYVPPTEEWCKS